jgi:hypothetical protein
VRRQVALEPLNPKKRAKVPQWHQIEHNCQEPQSSSVTGLTQLCTSRSGEQRTTTLQERPPDALHPVLSLKSRERWSHQKVTLGTPPTLWQNAQIAPRVVHLLMTHCALFALGGTFRHEGIGVMSHVCALDEV